ncbi:MAG: hypothetical protein JJT81_05240 [Rubellimicrobium sp.]|nr:hypothetical protein [Rubellimicrobium sp.]
MASFVSLAKPGLAVADLKFFSRKMSLPGAPGIAAGIQPIAAKDASA